MDLDKFKGSITELFSMFMVDDDTISKVYYQDDTSRFKTYFADIFYYIPVGDKWEYQEITPLPQAQRNQLYESG